MPRTLTLSQMAAEQGVDTSALRHAIRRGHLQAERAEDGRGWLVTRAEANRYARRTGPAPDGYLTAAEAAERLGRSRQRVHQMIADGKLPARRTRDGRVFIPADAVGEPDAAVRASDAL